MFHILYLQNNNNNKKNNIIFLHPWPGGHTSHQEL